MNKRVLRPVACTEKAGGRVGTMRPQTGGSPGAKHSVRILPATFKAHSGPSKTLSISHSWAVLTLPNHCSLWKGKLRHRGARRWASDPSCRGPLSQHTLSAAVETSVSALIVPVDQVLCSEPWRSNPSLRNSTLLRKQSTKGLGVEKHACEAVKSGTGTQIYNSSSFSRPCHGPPQPLSFP